MTHGGNSTFAPKLAARAADAVVSALEKRIYAGQLKSGSMLPPERELIEEFDISRTVAREAVKILGGKGLIDARPRHRPVVRRPDYEMALGVMGGLAAHLTERPEGVEHLFQTRIFVESALARRAATDANKDEIAALREALKRNGAQIQNSGAFYSTDMAFHAALYDIPRNPIFPALHRAFCGWLESHWRRMPRLPARNRRNHEAHKKIFEAILNRDPDAAEKFLRDHLEDAWTQVRRTFSADRADKEK